MKKLLFLLCLLVGAVFSALPVQAAIIDAPVPDNAYITYNDYDWAWASPCSSAACGIGFGLDLSYQSAFGWHIPTAEELALAPLATDFIFEGANVPLGGSDPVSGANFALVNSNLDGDAALAVPYFNSLYYHGDWGNAPGSGGVAGYPLLAWNGSGGETLASVAEFLVVRSVPEPATIVLLGSGLIGLGFFGRKRMKK